MPAHDDAPACIGDFQHGNRGVHRAHGRQSRDQNIAQLGGITGRECGDQVRALREACRIAGHALGGILQIALCQPNSAGQGLLHLRLVVILDRPEGTGGGQQASEDSGQKTQHEQAGA